ncbi:TRAP transporter, DctM subunit [Sphingomonas guangdongensis]|uniref:TRAP transporter large permease protein n=1 Tax=Sphingomonas guangdongensis TaxID=1141890 RepID=A0A285R2B5_9SPHN|nr:TRAP transporter large permease [Sphingomonas guangdongensis]SOB88243.1 TRAP transporter, DctM subunit [Sphingomonas guangdongensis]
MTPELIGALSIAVLLALLALGVPIAAVLGLVGFTGLALLTSIEAATIKAGVVGWETISRYELGVLPLFLLMAHLCFTAGASRDFFDAAAKLLGHRRGGLATASIAGCAGFGAISGSSLATAATVGLVALPEMRKRGYAPSLSTGSIAAGGTLGSLIPPSGALIVYGMIAEQPISKLFAAALVPVATQALLYIAVIILLCRRNPALGPVSERVPWRERFASLGRIADIAVLIVLVIGGLTVGWFTPTEAASIGSVLAMLLCARRGKLTIPALRRALAETLRTAGVIYAIIIGAIVFSVFLGATGLASHLTALVIDANLDAKAAAAVIVVVLLLLGSVLDGMALMLLTVPIFLPMMVGLGMSPIWFGIFVVRTIELGLVHPPLGMNVYIIQGIAKDVPLGTIFRGVLPFLAADMLHIALLILVPATALWLPGVLA